VAVEEAVVVPLAVAVVAVAVAVVVAEVLRVLKVAPRLSL
jgi:hypothetical protein